METYRYVFYQFYLYTLPIIGKSLVDVRYICLSYSSSPNKHYKRDFIAE